MPILLAFVVLFAIWINYQIRRSNKNTSEKDDFWQRETKANFTRKTDISSLNYITIPFHELPFSLEYGNYCLPHDIEEEKKLEIQSYEKIVLSLKDKKILNLTGYSNTDLKLAYGAANLPFLMQYDENFSKLSRALSKWGKLLFEIGAFSEAEKVLEFALSSKSDIEEVFFTLAKLYRQDNKITKLERLKASTDCFDELRRDSVLKRIQSI